MRAGRLIGLASVWLTVALTAPAGAIAKPCRTARGERTLVRNARVRIFETPNRSSTDPVKVFGCYGGTGLNVRIDRRHVDDAIGEVAFSGPVVGFADSTPSGGGRFSGPREAAQPGVARAASPSSARAITSRWISLVPSYSSVTLASR
ncbi:MAG: hypothetical protein QOD76_1413 [Solirubrobacteraceae bacterium]|jgi:hypothetical protein|nr:hypothetical protein [Solirubrobacteraceae bacterium]